MKKMLAVVALFSMLVAGCLHSPSQPQAGQQELPLEQAREMMIEEMQRTGGDAGVAKEPVAGDQSFTATKTRSGSFEALGYMTSGGASLEEKDGKHYVVFGDDFSTPNGPDLVVYLTKNAGKTSREDVRQGLELAELKSVKGRQVYEIPAGTQVSQYNSVTIHCRAFNVPWSYAPLN